MTNDTNPIATVLDQVVKATSFESIQTACEGFCDTVELEYYLFGLCIATSLNAPQVSTLSNYPEGWFDRYFDEGMQKHDPVVKYCFENTTPIRWDKLTTLPQYTDAFGTKVMALAAEVGLKNGISLPIKSPSGAIAIFSLATEREADFEERSTHAMLNAYSFAFAVLDAVTRIRLTKEQASENQETLTKRELDSLFWACEGKTAWEISKILGVSERTIIFHLTSATKKLGATNRQHAVAKAIMSGLIKPVI